MSRAVVVGSGPNGLAAAALLAKAGVEVTVIEAADEIGGGTRTSELTVPGVLHDHCAATHPMGVASPAFAELELERHGLEWLWPEVDLAHPLDGGRAAAMYRSLDRTVAELGPDGAAWRRLFDAPSRLFDRLNTELAQAVVHLPRHPLLLARFGLPALVPVSLLTRLFKDEEAGALFAGVAAHSFSPFSRPLSSAVGMALIAAGHARGWPVAKGGSIAITRALAAVLEEHGGRIETGRRVRSLSEVEGDADVVLLDLAPRGVVEIAGDRLPPAVRRAYERYRHGPAAFKLDLAVEGGVPWTAEACRRAGTIHVGGTVAEMAAAERDVNRGRMPERPFILVGQQYLADPSRSAGDVHPVWAYAHVPHAYEGDAREAILGQLERFAPGVRERIVGEAVRAPGDWQPYNPNFIGGDIVTGANSPRQMIFRPRVTLRPHDTGMPGVYLCSAATPPGGGVHGLCGAAAAARALAHLKL